MARRIGASCRLCRREGAKLFLKGTRCQTPKCAFERRGYFPGQHGQSRAKLSNYGLQLREKQKVKRIYGVLEKQFRFYFRKAEKQKGITGKMLLQMLERRLDSVVFRACFASSLTQGRQMVRHGHIFVDGDRINIPSYQVKPGQTVEFRGKENTIKHVKEAIQINTQARPLPDWIEGDLENLKAKVMRLPERKDIPFPVQEQLIVELYSK